MNTPIAKLKSMKVLRDKTRPIDDSIIKLKDDPRGKSKPMDFPGSTPKSHF